MEAMVAGLDHGARDCRDLEAVSSDWISRREPLKPLRISASDERSAMPNGREALRVMWFMKLVELAGRGNGRTYETMVLVLLLPSSKWAVQG
jgi:hypothetical protein